MFHIIKFNRSNLFWTEYSNLSSPSFLLFDSIFYASDFAFFILYKSPTESFVNIFLNYVSAVV